jgi:hypothetical protein
VGAHYAPPLQPPEPALGRLLSGLRAAERIPFTGLGGGLVRASHKTIHSYTTGLAKRTDRQDMLALWLLLRPLDQRYSSVAGICEEWGLIYRGGRAFAAAKHDPGWLALMKGLLGFAGWWERLVSGGTGDSSSATGRGTAVPGADSSAGPPEPRRFARSLVSDLLSDGDTMTYLGLNEYDGVVWFNRERLEELCWWLVAVALITIEESGNAGDEAGVEEQIALLARVMERVDAASRASEYRVDLLLRALEAAE